MSGNSSVGNSGVYEDGDQKNAPQSDAKQQKEDARFHEGKEHSHKANDASKSNCIPAESSPMANMLLLEDERTIANKLAREEKVSPREDNGNEHPWASTDVQ